MALGRDINWHSVKDSLPWGAHETYLVYFVSDEFPKEGSEIAVIGNPDGLKDIITNGVISEIREYDYLLTNKVYRGNSGGAIIYKGKIVGVINMILTFFEELTPPIIVNYSMGTNLKSIREFLDINEKKNSN